MTIHDRALAAIRTYVPYAIAAAFAWLYAHTLIDLRGDFEVALVAFTTVGVTNVYYAAIRVLEARLPWVGAFLGFPRAPEYLSASALWASLVRTGIPTFAGAIVFVLGYLVGRWFGLTLPEDVSAQLVVGAVAALEAGYYAAASWLVGRWPGAAWMLGGVLPPSYTPPRHRA